jgi:DNA polymerase-1
LRIVLDIEADGLQPTKIHCVVLKDIDTGRIYEFFEAVVLQKFLERQRISLVVSHNGFSYDWPVLCRLWGIRFDVRVSYDTLVASQLLEFTRVGGHSLEAWGETLGCPKIGADIADWSTLTPLMLERCRADVDINHKLYNHLQLKARLDYGDKFKDALKLEFRTARVCADMHDNGFGFDIDVAVALRSEIEARIAEIDNELTEAFPPTIKTIQLKTKTKVLELPFNPASPKQIVERLGPFWTPRDKTEKGQPKVNEANLATLKEEAPEACKRLVERLLLAGRERALTQWINAYDPSTARVHAEFRGIGTWTHRMGHRSPNLANIAAPKSIKYKAKDLADLATTYGSRMRGLWKADEGNWLVGTDAEGIQLRIFAHYINDPKFTEALINGNKDLGTDAHSLNATILRCDRDTAKTFIYAFLLGAGTRKLGEILGRGSREGARAKEDFIQAYPGLAALKQTTIPEDAKRKYFQSFDGRLVKCDSEHLMMAGYLQTGEACIMKWANRKWRQDLEQVAFGWRQVNLVHDEWQTEVESWGETKELPSPGGGTILVPESTLHVGRVQAESIKAAGEAFALNCPMAGNWRVGKNWLETH